MPTKSNELTAEQIADRIRNGDLQYGPDDLAAARAREEFDALQAEAKSRAEHDQLQAERARQVEQLRTDILAIDDTTAEQLAAVTAATEALDRLVTILQARGTRIAELGHRARQLGIAELRNGETDGTGLGWRRDPSTRAVTKFRVADRVVQAVDPAAAFRVFLGEYAARHRLNLDGKTPHVPLTELLAGQDQTIVPPPQVQVRLARRWGRHVAGDTVTVDQPTAAWLRSHGLAER